MDTPALTITRCENKLASTLKGHDARDRIRLLDAAKESAEALRARVASLRSDALRDYVKEVGATAASRELGISRGRVYQLIEER